MSNNTVVVSNNRPAGDIRLTPRNAMKVRHVQVRRGGNTSVHLARGLRVVTTNAGPDKRDDWRRPDVIARGENAPVEMGLAYTYAAHRLNCHILLIERQHNRQPSDATLERVLSVAHYGLCYCDECRTALDTEHPKHAEEYGVDSKIRDVHRTLVNGRVEVLSPAAYVLRWNLALANGLVTTPKNGDTVRIAPVVDDETLDRVLAGEDISQPEPVFVEPVPTPPQPAPVFLAEEVGEALIITAPAPAPVVHDIAASRDEMEPCSACGLDHYDAGHGPRTEPTPEPGFKFVMPTAAELRAREPVEVWEARVDEAMKVMDEAMGRVPGFKLGAGPRLSVGSDGNVYQCVRAPACPCVACRDDVAPSNTYSWGES
jgi:hypothetical protein